MCKICTALELVRGSGYPRTGNGCVFVVVEVPAAVEELGTSVVVFAAVPLCTCSNQCSDR